MAVLAEQKEVENKNCHSPLLPALSKDDAPEAILLSGGPLGAPRGETGERETERVFTRVCGREMWIAVYQHRRPFSYASSEVRGSGYRLEKRAIH